MQVLGAGLPRTGTLSTRSALQGFGLDPCIHGDTYSQNLDLCEKMMAFYDGNHQPLVDFLTKNGYKASLDTPTIGVFDELQKFFPDAKVLLTIRDSPASWVKSFRSTIWKLMELKNHLYGAGKVTSLNIHFTSSKYTSLSYERIANQNSCPRKVSYIAMFPETF